MNRLTLLYDTFCNAGKEIIDPSTFPYREVSPNCKKWWIGFFNNIFFKGYLGAEYKGLEYLPEFGPGIVAANHFSHLDGLLINGASAYRSRREVVFFAAQDLYEKNFIFKTMCNIVDCIPVKRDQTDKVSLLKAIRLLRSNKLFGIFPEGQRSRDGKIGEAKDGVAILALATGCPVIPMGIDGTYRALPRKSNFIKPVNVSLSIGKPLLYPKTKKPSETQIIDVREEIMFEIKKLRNEAVDWKENRLAA
ncbi:MAG TPA: lysophospholipid acyltransferase family protein [Thermodesulfobacteriota bacterium]|nr:lysophospholipid acyltransferase family protein [Thermodesulfobacteriota bacterium]